jgi:hypothetical protein
MKKVALVIGNGDYQNTDSLKNPVNDSRDIKNSLEKLGFSVVYGENLTRKEIGEKLFQFGDIANSSETAIFYYAGHGLQENGENYLLPVDAVIRKSADIPEESFSFSRIEREFGDLGNRSNIFILDACRDNPFESSMKSFADSRNIAFNRSRGLANPNMSVGNSIIAYSTSPNDIALDNPSESNGIYTKYLKEAILEAGVSIESIFKKVARAVKSETGNKQQPWVHSNSDRDIFLNGEAESFDEVEYNKVVEERLKAIREQQEKENREAEELKAKIEREKAERTAKLEQEARELEATKVETVVTKEPTVETVKIESKGLKGLFTNWIFDSLLLIGVAFIGYTEYQKYQIADYDYKIYGDVFVDKSTDLMWQKKNSSNIEDKFTWQEAKNYCSNLNLGGYSNWRLPTKSEAKSLLTYSYGTYDSEWSNWFDQNKHKRNNNRFLKKEISESVPLWTWTLTIRNAYSSDSWVVFFSNGNGNWNYQTYSYYAICVRGSSTGSE